MNLPQPQSQIKQHLETSPKRHSKVLRASILGRRLLDGKSATGLGEGFRHANGSCGRANAVAFCQGRGSSLSAFPWVLPCPLNIPEISIVFKILILVNSQWESKIKDHFSGWIDSSSNLNMLITCFLNVAGSADFFRCRISGDRPPLLQKVRTFGLGPLTGRLCYKKSELLGWDPPTPPK